MKNKTYVRIEQAVEAALDRALKTNNGYVKLWWEDRGTGGGYPYVVGVDDTLARDNSDMEANQILCLDATKFEKMDADEWENWKHDNFCEYLAEAHEKNDALRSTRYAP